MTSTADLIAERNELRAEADRLRRRGVALRKLAEIEREYGSLYGPIKSNRSDRRQPTTKPPAAKKQRRTAEPTVAEQRAEHYRTMRATRRAEFSRVRH